MARIFRPRYRHEVIQKRLLRRTFLAAGAPADDLLADDVESSTEVTSPALDHPPRVWLNATQTKTGADEMTVTAWSATSVTFTDPTGGQTGSLQLGVENTGTGEIGWIGVTVTSSTVDILSADDIESASEVSAPVLGHGYAFDATDVESASETSAPNLGQGYALLADDIESQSETSQPSLGQVANLLADDVESASEVSAPSLGTVHVLLANGVQSISLVTGPVLGQSHVLLADDIESESEVSSPTLDFDVDAIPALDIPVWARFRGVGLH